MLFCRKNVLKLGGVFPYYSFSELPLQVLYLFRACSEPVDHQVDIQDRRVMEKIVPLVIVEQARIKLAGLRQIFHLPLYPR